MLGTKGRVAFEAPAAEVLITAHRELEKLVCEKIGFDASYAVTGQTYSRKIDAQAIDAGIGRWVDAVGDPARISFAAKANTNLAVLARLESFGVGAEVATLGELARARKAGFDPNKQGPNVSLIAIVAVAVIIVLVLLFGMGDDAEDTPPPTPTPTTMV